MSAIPTTMMALRAHARGGPEQLVYEQAPTPRPGPGEALVEVHAAAITFAELTWDQTWTDTAGQDRTPTIPSHEVSGTVVGHGPDAGALRPGQEVYGLIDFDRNGAAAQYVTLPAADLATRPGSISHVEAATLPLAALTAWQALVDHAALKPGEGVLVTGGAGGVGSYVVQLAAALGGVVTATGRAAQRDFVLSLGAGAFLASDAAGGVGEGAAPTQEDGFDVVIDTVGGPVLDASYPLARRGGRLVTLSAPPDADKAEKLGLQAMFFVVTPDAAQLAHLATLVDDGKLRPVLSQTFPLQDGRAAFESATRPHPPGKTVLIVR
jgi:NADPH:quinone reductase-like Zn-dependent oxidoreductase